MKTLKTEELSNLSDEDLVKKLDDMRSELSTLRSKAARGTLKKQLGEIKSVRRNIARVLTAVNSRKRSVVENKPKKRKSSEAPVEESKQE